MAILSYAQASLGKQKLTFGWHIMQQQMTPLNHKNLAQRHYLRRSSATARKLGDKSIPASCASGNLAAKRRVLSPAEHATSTAFPTVTP